MIKTRISAHCHHPFENKENMGVKQSRHKVADTIAATSKFLDTIKGTNKENRTFLHRGNRVGFLPTVFILIPILFSACVPHRLVETAATPDQPISADVTETSVPKNELKAEPEITMEMVTIEIPVEVSDYGELLSSTGEAGVFHVDFEEGMPSEHTLANNRPLMPTFIWYFNGTESDSVDSVTIEFNLIETIAPLDPVTFGYNRGFFIGIHNFDTIPIMPPWVPEENLEDVLVFSEQRGGDTDRDVFLGYPELAVNMQKYVERDGNQIRMVIPYTEFLTAAKNLTLQFLPGTTFGNLTAHLTCVEGLDLGKLTHPIESVQTDVFHDQVLPLLRQADESNMMPASLAETRLGIEDMVYGNAIVNQGLSINSDGSINMPVAMYDIGDYADEVQGEYAVMPEGLVSVFLNLQMEFFNNAQRRQVIELALSMIDETGHFAGLYDISQMKIVAADRKVPALPILSAMLLYKEDNLITAAEIDPIINSIVNNQIVRVGNTIYYAHNGIGEDDVMVLKLSDFAINNHLFNFLTQYSVDSDGRLDEKFGCALLLEGFANSLDLLLKAQEQNPTRLPAPDVSVLFHEDYSYELQPSGTFSIDNSYFAMWLMTYDQFSQILDVFKGGNDPSLDAFTRTISPDRDGSYSEKQQEKIREMMAMYGERYNAYKIVNTYYQSCLDIYNFVKMQNSSTIYAAGYDVSTGEVIADDSVKFFAEFENMTPFRARFGSPSVSANWLNLVGMFNDEGRVKETAHLTMINFDMHVGWVLGFQNLDYFDPDSFAKNGFNVWGYDSLKYLLHNLQPATSTTRFVYETCGASFHRENWLEFTLRKLNENRPEEQALAMEDRIPLFYDHVPNVTIVD